MIIGSGQSQSSLIANLLNKFDNNYYYEFIIEKKMHMYSMPPLPKHSAYSYYMHCYGKF